MKIKLNGKPFEGSTSNTVENVEDGVRRCVGESVAALGGKEGTFECSEIPGRPGLVVTVVVKVAGKEKEKATAKDAKGAKEGEEGE